MGIECPPRPRWGQWGGIGCPLFRLVLFGGGGVVGVCARCGLVSNRFLSTDKRFIYTIILGTTHLSEWGHHGAAIVMIAGP